MAASKSSSKKSESSSRSHGRGHDGKSSESKSKGSGSKGYEHQVEGAAETTTDHEQIRRWAEERGGKPACVKGTGGGGDTGLLRIDFPGYSGADSLQHISWDEWFEKFDEKNLALLYQDETKDGKKSNFNKLVSR